jgi:hypothetical protein
MKRDVIPRLTEVFIFENSNGQILSSLEIELSKMGAKKLSRGKFSSNLDYLMDVVRRYKNTGISGERLVDVVRWLRRFQHSYLEEAKKLSAEQRHTLGTFADKLEGI